MFMLHEQLLRLQTAVVRSGGLLSDLAVYRFLEPAGFLGMLDGHASVWAVRQPTLSHAVVRIRSRADSERRPNRPRVTLALMV